jgi:NADPH-dependent 2,4-dienoyl-CoA reductase/sulfur reductase-like enzyme
VRRFLLDDRYRSRGAALRLGAIVAGFREDDGGALQAVELADGTEIRCDVAVVGIGIEPARELVPDRRARRPFYTCGDVTASGGHWSSAAAQGAAVADRILGLRPAPSQPPFFWSDQFGLRLQLVGATTHAVAVAVEGEPDTFTARYHDDRGHLVAALAVNRPSEVATLRKDVAASSPDPAPAMR